MVVHINSVGLFGLDAFMVQAEADLSPGLPAFDIVGLPDAAVKESRDRVRSAMRNCGFEFPGGRITINLAPADIRKQGPLYDLPILIALLSATEQISTDLSDSVFIGEVSLSGEVRRINGVLPMAILAQSMGYKNIFVPQQNGSEAAVVEGINVFAVKDIESLYMHLTGQRQIVSAKNDSKSKEDYFQLHDFSQVRGQFEAKRALEIAAAGGHNILLIGPPGAGKSMLAKRVPSILPDMTFQETIETTKIHSVAGCLPTGESLITERPFRAPHHTVSPAGLSGGGTIPRPGEISLAHNGVLFLDELPEFSRSAMEVLRQPIEDGTVTISRASGTLSYPCSVMLIAAMNPCPCGFFNHPVRKCTCSDMAVDRYLNRVSGPLLDRLDIHVEVPPVDFDELSAGVSAEPSSAIRERVNRARKIQTERLQGTNIPCNARLLPNNLTKICVLEPNANSLLKSAFEKMGLSARAYDRILKVARTIADLDESETIKASHIAEAVQYRSLDRKYWGKHQ
ncbi:MAG: YifB family Mg chelatase-like AAA ATPase [Bacillota bacterium]|nr:YifB family Mg chelatase-like AAA ATPase [Bacillota bacterium]